MQQPEYEIIYIDPTQPFLKVIEERAQRFHPYPQRLLEQFRTIPRRMFVPDEFLDRVDQDVGYQQLLTQPSVMFYMLGYLFLKGNERIFEGGTGTGYQTAILARLAKHVYTVELDKERLEAARERLARLGITNVTFVHGDAAEGLPQYAPFDRMIFGAAIHGKIDQSLTNQMAPRSRLLAPTGEYIPQQSRVVGDLLVCNKDAQGIVKQEINPIFNGTLFFAPLISRRSIGWTALKDGYVPSTFSQRLRRNFPWNRL
jgi:protein-L-isoaspartate(D-aspartate) O-methyltransferase